MEITNSGRTYSLAYITVPWTKSQGDRQSTKEYKSSPCLITDILTTGGAVCIIDLARKSCVIVEVNFILFCWRLIGSSGIIASPWSLALNPIQTLFYLILCYFMRAMLGDNSSGYQLTVSRLTFKQYINK